MQIMSNDAYKQLLKGSTPEGMSLQETLRKSTEEAGALKQKEMVLYKNKIDSQYDEFEERKTSLDALKNIKVDVISDDYYNQLAEANTEYFTLAKNSARFLDNEDFLTAVPFFARNLIFLGAESGNGKSTIAANLALQTIRQNKRVLLITNEEVPSDCYNRVTSLIKGWAYNDHTKFTPEQVAEFNEYYPKLGQRMTVIADLHNNIPGTTTTYEGLKALCESLQSIQTQYDVIIIDYFQNISTSTAQPHMEEWKVLDKVANFLDNFRKVYAAPIILLGQLKPAGENPAPFKERIERCKSIYNRSTCAAEVRADVPNSLTVFHFYKSRFNACIGKDVKVGFDRGRYVRFTSEFASKIVAKIAAQQDADMREKIMKAN